MDSERLSIGHQSTQVKRVLTALVIVPVTLAAVFFAPAWLFTILALILALLAQREFFDIAEAAKIRAYRWIAYTVTTLLALRMSPPMAILAETGHLPVPTLAMILIAGLIAALIRAVLLPERIDRALSDAGLTALGLLYPGLLLLLVLPIREVPGGAWWLLYLFVVVWSGDIAAYYAGRAWGERKLAPRVSPNKTWAGTVASLLASIVFGGLSLGWIFAHAEGRSLFAGLVTGALLAVPFNVAAQFGDLAESVCKRAAGVKDSGQILPGHGGILDRIDALLLALPCLWYYLAFRG